MTAVQSLNAHKKIVLGKITTVHGVCGWVKVYSWTQPVENIFSYPVWWLKYPDGSMEEVVIEKTRTMGKGLAVLIKGCHDRDQARAYVNAKVLIETNRLPALKKGEFYWHQLEGLTVMISTGEHSDVNIGNVERMMDTGANDVMVVRPKPDSIDDRERLIPWVEEEVIRSVDLDSGCIRINWDPDF